MKKISIFAMLAFAGLFFASCDESFDDWANPQTNPQEDAVVIPGFTASAVGNIDLGNAEETVKVFSLSEALLPNGAYVDKLRMAVTPQGVEGEEQTVEAVSADGYFSASVLQSLVTGYFGKRPEARTLSAHVYADVMQDGQAFLVDAGTIDLNITPKASKISDRYYLVGGALDWAASAASKEQVFSHSDADVYDDPVFTYVMEGTGSEMWFAFGDDEACDAITNDGDWSKLFGTNGASTDLTGTFDYRYNLDGDHSFCVDGKAVFYRITINMMDFTYEIVPLNFAEYIYEAGNDNGWGAIEKPLYCENGDGIYTGWFEVRQADWGIGFKFRGNKDDWNNGNYGAGTWSDTGGTLVNDGGSGNLEATPGFYRADVNLGNLTYTLTRVNVIDVIGDATENGWSSGIDMTYNADELCWEVTTTLKPGGMKFRANNSWDNADGNWGGSSFDNIINGSNDNLPVTVEGTYHIKFYPLCNTRSYCTIEAVN